MADSQDVPRHAGQVVHRVLLRRNIAIDAETAQLVAAAVQAALQASAPCRPPPPTAARSRRPQRAAVLIWHRPPSSFRAGDTFVRTSQGCFAARHSRGSSGPSPRATAVPRQTPTWCAASASHPVNRWFSLGTTAVHERTVS
jgi:hypothetical protein